MFNAQLLFIPPTPANDRGQRSHSRGFQNPAELLRQACHVRSATPASCCSNNSVHKTTQTTSLKPRRSSVAHGATAYAPTRAAAFLNDSMLGCRLLVAINHTRNTSRTRCQCTRCPREERTRLTVRDSGTAPVGTCSKTLAMHFLQPVQDLVPPQSPRRMRLPVGLLRWKRIPEQLIPHQQCD